MNTAYLPTIDIAYQQFLVTNQEKEEGQRDAP
jgi:hypothetical protein